MKIEIPSSNGNSSYTVDTEEVTCTCPNFKYRCSHHTKDREERLCKHLVKVYSDHPELKPSILINVQSEMDKSRQDPDGKVRYDRSIFDLYITDLRALINSHPEIIKYEICGSYRRLQKRVSDLDVLIVLQDGVTWDSFLDDIENLYHWHFISDIGKGDKKASYLADGFIQMDFKNIPLESFPFAMLHFTGSKEMNISMRSRANKLGYKLNEYGLFRLLDNSAVTGLNTEKDIFDYLELPYLEPFERYTEKEKEYKKSIGLL